MNDYEQPKALAQAKENKPLFPLGVVRIVNQERPFVGEDRPSVFERDLVLPEINLSLLRIPFEPDRRHS